MDFPPSWVMVVFVLNKYSIGATEWHPKYVCSVKKNKLQRQKNYRQEMALFHQYINKSVGNKITTTKLPLQIIWCHRYCHLNRHFQ